MTLFVTSEKQAEKQYLPKQNIENKEGMYAYIENKEGMYAYTGCIPFFGLKNTRKMHVFRENLRYIYWNRIKEIS